MDWIGCVRQPKHEVKYGPDNYLGCCSIDAGISFLTGLLAAGRPEYSQGIVWKEWGFFAKSVSSLCFLLFDRGFCFLGFFQLLAKISSIF